MRTTIRLLDDLRLLRESVELECKLAAGRDGQGKLPEDFWPTYSAFANTQGGTVVLGVKEKNGEFSVQGIADPGKIRKELFDCLNNRQKVSANVLTDAHVRESLLEGKRILEIDVPRAPRKQRPVHLTANPFGNTYRRLNDGDRVLSDEEVRRMMAEQVEDSRDVRILRGYDLGDLNAETLRAYRQVFTSLEPTHPWTALEDREFLRQVGGWRQDRETGESGLTLAGLLMFGEMASIQEELPNYMLDYQERPEAKTERRWIDRLTLDGKWSGNLFDFYRKVYLKLTADLKVPFRLERGERKDVTPVHEALREALANTLVHADYSDRASVLVVKRPDMFGFRNPGMMRIPVEVALQGGESDCRNRTLHKMFRQVGAGEQAGSGVPKILEGWKSQHWSPPKLVDSPEPYNQTILELRMLDLFPNEAMASLRARLGPRFEGLAYVERVALALAASEGTVNHARLRAVTAEHPVDLSKTLQHLTQEGMLESTGGRGAVYHLPGQAIPTPEDVFGSRLTSSGLTPAGGVPAAPARPAPRPARPGGRSRHWAGRPAGPAPGTSSHLGGSSSHLGGSSPHLTEASAELDGIRDGHGCLVSPQISGAIIDDIERLSPELRARLEAMADLPRNKRKVAPELLAEVILNVCAEHFVTLRSLAALVNRNPAALRNQYLTPLVRERKLTLAFPTRPTHELQAYKAVRSDAD